MSSFTRYAAVAVVVLSLGFLVASAPVTSYASIPAITGDDPVSLVLVKILFDIELKIKTLLECGTRAEINAAVQVVVALFKACNEELLKIGADVEVDVKAKANIAAFFCAIITLCAQVCAQLVIKVGLTVVIEVFAQVDVVLRLCLTTLDVCIVGIVALIAKAIASVTVGLLAQVQLKLCLGVLGL